MNMWGSGERGGRSPPPGVDLLPPPGVDLLPPPPFRAKAPPLGVEPRHRRYRAPQGHRCRSGSGSHTHAAAAPARRKAAAAAPARRQIWAPTRSPAPPGPRARGRCRRSCLARGYHCRRAITRPLPLLLTGARPSPPLFTPNAP
jgi:hypothetical protein